MKRFIIFCFSMTLLLSVCVSGCSKDSDYIKQVDYNTVGLLIGDNFNLSTFYSGMRPIGLHHTLQQQGPFTVLVPSDQAFANQGLTAQDLPLLASKELSRLMHYHVIDGTYDLHKLPFVFNQEVRSKEGKLYVTHWVKEGDTILTINGSKTLLFNIPASNGLIHIIDRVLKPHNYPQLLDAISDNNSLSFFREAVRVAGMEGLLKEAKEYTVFAPDNAALKAFGWTSLEYIRAQKPEDLAVVLRYHILASRRFVYDYVLSSDKNNKNKQSMLNGFNLDVQYFATSNESIELRLQAPGNTTPITVTTQDILADNGILHIVGGVLKLTR